MSNLIWSYGDTKLDRQGKLFILLNMLIRRTVKGIRLSCGSQKIFF